MFDKHRRRRLTNATAFSLEKRILDPPAVIHAEFDADSVAAQWVCCLIGVRGKGASSAMKRLFVMIEDPVLVERVVKHGQAP
jgi:hypothetical protein